MRRLMIATAILAFGVASSTACATKGYVRTQVGQVSGKVDSLSQSLEETQERTKRNEAKINEVDQKAVAARGAADQAQQAAVTADGKAVTAHEAAKAVDVKVEEVSKAMRKLIYEVVLTEDSGNFKFGSATLPDEAKARIDELMGKLLADPKGAYFEVEGHTDNVGDEATNERLGMERADAVKRYLYEQHKVPLHRINVISYGETKPAVENTNSKARAQNRRVVIRILA